MPDGSAGRRGQAAAPLLRAVELTRHFRVGGLFGHTLHAVDAIDLVLDAHEIVAVVGESGSGKSTVARLLALVYRPTGGDILFRGRSVRNLRHRRDILAYRGQVPMVFQDPFSSLNPVHRIGYVLDRGLRLHRAALSRGERREEAARVLEAVGLSPGRDMLLRYPHELSGGQRQRVGFAQALSYGPKAVLADEPVSMLDVSIRIGILNLMSSLCEELGVSFLYITHDLASARYVANRIMVMYAGQVVEQGPTEEVLWGPLHPYTRLLLSAVPDPRAPLDLTAPGPSEPPRVIDPGEGCRFRTRCALAQPICGKVTPQLRPAAPSHYGACHVTVGAPTCSGTAAA